jgi:hypothetical protein
VSFNGIRSSDDRLAIQTCFIGGLHAGVDSTRPATVAIAMAVVVVRVTCKDDGRRVPRYARARSRRWPNARTGFHRCPPVGARSGPALMEIDYRASTTVEGNAPRNKLLSRPNGTRAAAAVAWFCRGARLTVVSRPVWGLRSTVQVASIAPR